MMKKYIFIFSLLCFCNYVNAQDTIQEKQKDTAKIASDDVLRDTLNITHEKDTTNKNNIDLVAHEHAVLLDSLWLSEMYCSPLLDDNYNFVIEEEEIDSLDIATVDLPTEVLKERLAMLDSQTPFNVEYNSSLEKIIKSYLKHRRESIAILMSRAAYYFPIFEEYLAKYDMPMELKYLAIVESALKPRANSPVGARGLWQFMYQTGKQFDLNVSSYVDERQDPIKATEAACQYLSLLYRIFDDWDLALAAYNSGPGNVNKAIRRSGGKRNYWNIRNYLPRETAGYLPAFYATLYIFEYAEYHDLKPKKAVINAFETDTIHLKKQVTFEQLSKYLDVEVEMVQFLNPQYKLDIVPYVKGKNNAVRLPLYNVGQFTSNEESLYAHIDVENAKREKTQPEYVEMQNRIRYRVVSGDYLGKIADKYGVRVSDIKRWNGLRSNNLSVGQRLTIYPRKVPSSTNSSKQKKTVSAPKGEYVTYVVEKGDSLWIIAEKYKNVSVQNLKDWNGIGSAKSLQPGMKLKIYKI